MCCLLSAGMARAHQLTCCVGNRQLLLGFTAWYCLDALSLNMQGWLEQDACQAAPAPCSGTCRGTLGKGCSDALHCMSALGGLPAACKDCTNKSQLWLL